MRKPDRLRFLEPDSKAEAEKRFDDKTERRNNASTKNKRWYPKTKHVPRFLVRFAFQDRFIFRLSLIRHCLILLIHY